MKFAVIDIGSNSVRLLLWADGSAIYKKKDTTRLGEGLSLTGELSAAAMERSSAAVGRFVQEGKSAGADRIYAFATAAVRRARNGDAFVRKVYEECGQQIDVLSGEREAVAGLVGALKGKDGAILDIGGASTEVTVQRGGRVAYAVSADIGAVRLKDLCGEDAGRLAACIAEKLDAFAQMPPIAQPVAIGGTATSLAAVMYGIHPYDPAKIDGCLLPQAEVEAWAARLLSMPQAERLALRGMDPQRADILGGGALLLAMLLKKMGADSALVSESDNLEGYLALALRGGGA